MATFTINNVSQTAGQSWNFSWDWVYSTATMPTGLTQDPNGVQAALITAANPSLAGRLGTGRAAVWVADSNGSNQVTSAAFNVPQATTASLQGNKSLTKTVVGGQALRVGVDQLSTPSIALLWGRGPVSGITPQANSGPTSWTNYSLNIRVTYYTLPTAPRTLTAVPATTVGDVNVSWQEPSNNGGQSITEYLVEWATDAGFTTNYDSDTTGSTSLTVTSLTPSSTYYFRVSAINPVATAHSTTGPRSSVVSTLIPTGTLRDYWTTIRSNDMADSGTWSFRHRLNVPDTLGGSGSQVLRTVLPVADLLGLDFSRSFTVSVWVFAEEANAGVPLTTNRSLTVTAHNSAGTQVGSWSLPMASRPNGVLTVNVPGIPAGATELRSVLDVTVPWNGDPGTNTDSRVYVDAHLVSYGSSVSFFDGNSPGATWEGVTNNSVSQMPNPDAQDLYDAAADNNRILSVGENQYSEVIIDAGVHAIRLYQPVISNVLPNITVPVGIGTYNVIAGDQLPVVAEAWTDYGGSVTVRVGDRPGQLVVMLQGPRTIPGVPGPFRLALSDGENEYARLRIAGTGVKTTREPIRIYTGANPDVVTAVDGPSIDSPFVTDVETAYDVGAGAAKYLAGSYPVVEFDLGTDKLNEWGSLVGGSFVFRESLWRIQAVTIRNAGVSITAYQYNRVEDFMLANPDKLVGDFDSYWGQGKVKNFNTKPLRGF